MKIYISIIFLLLYNLYSTYSQTIDKKGYISIDIGAGIPTGEYGSTDYKLSNSGFANTGLIYGLSLGYRLGKNFGISGLLRLQTNSTDVQSMSEQLILLYPGINWNIKSGSWNMGSLMAGIYGGFPLDVNAKSIFEIREMFGFTNVSSPELTISGYNGGSTATATQTSKTVAAFSYLIGAGFRFNITNSVAINLYTDYTGVSPDFKNIIITSNVGQNSSTSFSQNCNSFNFSFGLAFLIN